MDIHLLLIFQIFADFVLCIAILFLLRQLNKKVTISSPTLPAVSEKAIGEFKTLLEESQLAASNFLAAMEESRRELREFVQLLDKKEQSCREIIEQSGAWQASWRGGGGDSAPSLPAHPYRELMEMSGQGLTVPEIAKRTGLAEGEIGLILDLHRSK